MNTALSYAFDEYPIPPWNDYLTLDAQRYNGSTNEWEPAIAGQIKTDLTGSFRVMTPNVAPYSNTPWTFAPFSQPLPIELIDFEALDQGRSVLLKWSTASETDNDFFSIQRSSDANEFYTIGEINGALNSTYLWHV